MGYPCASTSSSAEWGKEGACLTELLCERSERSCVRPFRDAQLRVRAQESGPCCLLTFHSSRRQEFSTLRQRAGKTPYPSVAVKDRGFGKGLASFLQTRSWSRRGAPQGSWARRPAADQPAGRGCGATFPGARLRLQQQERPEWGGHDLSPPWGSHGIFTEVHADPHTSGVFTAAGDHHVRGRQCS